MKFLTATVAAAFVVAAGIYTLRATQAGQDAESDQAVGPILEPQVEGRWFSWVSAGFDGSSGGMACEYDAMVEIDRDSAVVALPDRQGMGGPGLPVEIGERVEGLLFEWSDRSGVAAHGLETFGMKVWRDQDGVLHEGCAPESVRRPAPSPGPIEWTPPPIPPGWTPLPERR